MDNVVTTLAPSFLIFDWIFLILAGNKDSHKSLDEFKSKVEPTSACEVNCPLAS